MKRNQYLCICILKKNTEKHVEMNKNFVLKHCTETHTVVTWELMQFVNLRKDIRNDLNVYRYKAWQSLNIKEKNSILHTWEQADVQHMENEEGPVDTIAVMFETKNDERDGFIIVYIDIKTKNVTGSENFF